MNELVLHHTYENGAAFDISGHLNHGTPVSVTPGSGDYSSSFRFEGGESRISVERSQSLSELRSIRLRMRFYPFTIGSEELTLPLTLVEADGSFGVQIQAMAGTLSVWVSGAAGGTTSLYSTASVSVGEWNDLELFHDGIGELRLFLNGGMTAVRGAVPPVAGVGPNGLVVGHSSDPGALPESTFQGYVDEVSLHRYDPREDIERLVDLCCVDRTKLDDLVARARANGWDAERLGAKVRDVLDLGSEIAGAARAGDEQRSAEQRRLSREAALALGSPDRRALYYVIERFDASIREELTQSDLEGYGQRAAQQLADWPFSLADLVELGPAFCWERFLPEGFGRRPTEDEGGEDGERDGEPPGWPAGDPDTDRPADHPPDDWVQDGEEPPGGGENDRGEAVD